MSAVVQIEGTWVNVKEAWVKRSGVWTKSTGTYFKIDGVWTLVQSPPGPPPQAPVLTLEVTAAKHIDVGVRYPATNDDPNIELIRVLVSRTAMPTSQFGSGAIAENDNDWPAENWSNWWFANNYNDKGVLIVHSDTSVVDHKQYPVNAKPVDPPLPQGQWYYFAAWTKDVNQQWSVGTFSKIFVPVGSITGVIAKEANLRPNTTGTLTGATGVTWHPELNDMTVNYNTFTAALNSKGVGFYGNKFTDAIGSDGTPSAFKATIRITRDAADLGPATTNVWAFWHDVNPSAGDNVPLGSQLNKTLIGQIAKGQTATYDLPSSWDSHWNADIKGIGFGWSQTPVTSDSSHLLGQNNDPRAGEVNIQWTETP